MNLYKLSTPRRMLTVCALSSVLLTLSLSGCGSGGGAGNSVGVTDSKSATVNVYVTDGFTDQYSQVLVTLYGIDVSADGGTTWTNVYTDTAGETVDLASLSSSAQLLSTVTVPAETITNVRLTFGDEATLTPKSGAASQTVTFSATAPNVIVANDEATVSFAAPTKVAGGRLSNLVIDFDLAAFELVGNQLRPSVGLCSPAVFANKQRITYIPGTVSNLVAGTSFTLSLPRPGNGVEASVSVNLSSTTVVSNNDGTAAMLADGDSVVVQGSVDATTGAVDAQTVSIVPTPTAAPTPSPSPSSPPSGSPTTNPPPPPAFTNLPDVSAIGVVQSVDSTDSQFVVRVRSGEHFPHPMGGFTVQTSASTVFQSGQSTVSLSSVTAGTQVALVGTFDPTTGVLTAQDVIILTAPST